MSENNRFTKPVAFNRKKLDDQKILKHVARRNFSGYVKKLILADIAVKEAESPKESASTIPAFSERNEENRPKRTTENQPKNAAERLAEMKQQIKKTDKVAGPQIFIPKD